MFKLQIFGTRQEASGVMKQHSVQFGRLAHLVVCLGAEIYPHIHVHLPLIFIGWKTALLERNLCISNEGPIPKSHSISKLYLAEICLYGSCTDGVFSPSRTALAICKGCISLLIHFPLRSEDSFGQPTNYSACEQKVLR